MTNSYYIHNAHIINENERFAGAVYIKDGLIGEIFHGNAPSGFSMDANTVVIDAKEKFLIPGVIDDHVHVREPGLTGKGDIHSESRAAVAGGVTSYMEMPNTRPNATTLGILEEKFTLAATSSLANYSFYLGATNDNIGEILKSDPASICGLKLFLGASTGNMLVDNPETLDAIFADSPLLICVHAEEESIIRDNTKTFAEKYGDVILVLSLPKRPSTLPSGTIHGFTCCIYRQPGS